MTERLQRIHAILRAGQVPCALGSRPGLGTVLQAGTPDTGMWDVVVHDTGSELWIHDSHGAVQLPDDLTDTGVGDAIKLQVVRAWAEQGNQQAQELVATLEQTGWPHSGFDRSTGRGQHHVPVDLLQFFDPLQMAERMFDAASRMGSMLLAPPAGSAALTVWSPWGTLQFGYTRR